MNLRATSVVEIAAACGIVAVADYNAPSSAVGWGTNTEETLLDLGFQALWPH